MYNDPYQHPLYGHSLAMGGWVKLGNNMIRPRPSQYKPDNQLSFAPAFFSLVNNPETDDELVYGEDRVYAVRFQGTITDGFGTREYPHFSWFDINSGQNEGEPQWQKSTETPDRIVERNGCFKDGNQWKSRMYFVDHNR